jgi:hypothetical protein
MKQTRIFLLLAAFTFSLSSFGQGTRSAAPESYGTDMFKVHPELPGIIVHWFVSTLLIRPARACRRLGGCANPQRSRIRKRRLPRRPAIDGST